MSRALLASLRGILCHITNNQPLNEVITAIQENNYEVVQFQGRKIQIKELTKKHLHHFDFARLSPPVHPGPWRPIMSLRHSALSKKRREARLVFFPITSARPRDLTFICQPRAQKCNKKLPSGCTVTTFCHFLCVWLTAGEIFVPSENSLAMFFRKKTHSLFHVVSNNRLTGERRLVESSRRCQPRRPRKFSVDIT